MVLLHEVTCSDGFHGRARLLESVRLTSMGGFLHNFSFLSAETMHHTKWIVRIALLLLVGTVSTTAYLLLHYDEYRQEQVYRQMQYLNSR